MESMTIERYATDGLPEFIAERNIPDGIGDRMRQEAIKRVTSAMRTLPQELADLLGLDVTPDGIDPDTGHETYNVQLLRACMAAAHAALRLEIATRKLS